MNVYFIDPTYVKPEAWDPLLTYLKVKATYSFIPKDQLPDRLYNIIQPGLKATYAEQDLKKFEDNAAFWLKAHFEKHMQLIPSEYKRINDVPKEELKSFALHSPIWNLKNLDEANCLILMRLQSSIDSTGQIHEPVGCTSSPTHISNYCLNILNKKSGHYRYREQSAFIVFDEFLTMAFRFEQNVQKWKRCDHEIKNGPKVNFMKIVNNGIHNLFPFVFPLTDFDGVKSYASLRTSEGDDKYYKFIDGITYLEDPNTENYIVDNVDQLNRSFG